MDLGVQEASCLTTYRKLSGRKSITLDHNFVCSVEATRVLEDSPFTIRQVWNRLLRYNYASEAGTSKETLLWLKPHDYFGRQFTVCCLILIAKMKELIPKMREPSWFGLSVDTQSFYKKSLKQSENEALSWRGQAEFMAKMFSINLEYLCSNCCPLVAVGTKFYFSCLPLRELWPFFGQTIKW